MSVCFTNPCGYSQSVKIKSELDSAYYQLTKTVSDVEAKFKRLHRPVRAEVARQILEKDISLWNQFSAHLDARENKNARAIVELLSALDDKARNKRHITRRDIEPIFKLAKAQLRHYFAFYNDPLNSPF